MSNLNLVLVMGNLTGDPELRYTPKGTAVGDLALAINEKYKAADGSFKESTTYVDVTIWGRQAETCKEHLSKGKPVLIEGRLKLDTWEKEGKKYSKLCVVAERVQFIGGNSRPREEVLENPNRREDAGDHPPF